MAITGSEEKECQCSPKMIQSYFGKISGPLMDRIDLQIQVKSVKFSQLKKEKTGESSCQIKERVNHARKIQQERYKGLGIYSNSELTPKLLETYCKLDVKSQSMLQIAFEKLGLSARAYSRILKVARTIADLDGKKNIEIEHLAEAIQYRCLDKNLK